MTTSSRDADLSRVVETLHKLGAMCITGEPMERDITTAIACVQEVEGLRKGESYLVIQCGYEGIEKLDFLTPNATDAVNRVLDYRRKIEAAKKLRSDMGDDAFYAAMGKEGGVTLEQADLSRSEPDSVCVRKWDGTEFKCVCSELNVSPTETWIM